MKLLVNGKEETVSHIGETLGDLLLHIEKEGVPQGNVVRSIKLDGEKLFCAYQPVKKQISYRFDRGLSPGEHQLNITVLDKVGNKIEKNILFKCE